MKDSGIEWLGEIPAHWSVPLLRHVAEVRGGVTKGRKLPELEIIEVPYLRVANVQDGFLDLGDIKNIEVSISEFNQYALQAGDVLMNEGGDNDKLGRGAVWRGEIEPCLHQNHVFAVRPKVPNISEWLALLTQSKYGKHYFWMTAKQSTNLASISSSNIKRLPVILPPEFERTAIVEYMDKELNHFDVQNEKISLAIEKLEEYRSALITNAVTGQIKVA
jgi:type I restriction enzyme S subunit